MDVFAGVYGEYGVSLMTSVKWNLRNHSYILIRLFFFIDASHTLQRYRTINAKHIWKTFNQTVNQIK